MGRANTLAKACRTHAVHEELPIRPGEVGTTGHGRQVGFSFAGLQRQTGQLPIHQVKAKVLLFGFRQPDVILRNLVPKATRPTVHRHHDLTHLVETEDTSRLRIVDLLDRLHLTKMIARAEAPGLLAARWTAI